MILAKFSRLACWRLIGTVLANFSCWTCSERYDDLILSEQLFPLSQLTLFFIITLKVYDYFQFLPFWTFIVNFPRGAFGKRSLGTLQLCLLEQFILTFSLELGC